MTRNNTGTQPHVKAVREPQFELLRILLMLMMLILHYLTRADALLTLGVPAGSVRLTGSFIESFLIVASNTWVLISGYFLSRSSFRLPRLIELILEVWFYTFVVSFVMRMVHVYEVPAGDSLFRFVQYLFPVTAGHYWFASAYVLLYLLSPVLNAGIKSLTKRQLEITIGGLLFFFCLVKSVIPVNFATDDYGYGLKWFIVLYLIGAYIRSYPPAFLEKKRNCLLLYLLSGALIYVLTVVLHTLNLHTGRMSWYFSVMSHYNYLPCLTASIGLFALFRHVRINNGAVAGYAVRLSPYVLGVYLLHEHIEIRDRWFPWMEGIFGDVPTDSVPRFLLHFVLCVAVLFVSCIFIDWVRAVLFRFVARGVRYPR